jgi:hypothetical protein
MRQQIGWQQLATPMGRLYLVDRFYRAVDGVKQAPRLCSSSSQPGRCVKPAHPQSPVAIVATAAETPTPPPAKKKNFRWPETGQTSTDRFRQSYRSGSKGHAAPGQTTQLHMALVAHENAKAFHDKCENST